MLKDSLAALAGALLIAQGAVALAASTVDLSLKGAITPSACTPSLSDGGVVDYGKIAAKDLSPTGTTVLPRLSLQLTVDCEAQTLFALTGRDNRLGSSIFPALNHMYGLGMVSGNVKLGAYQIGVFDPVADDKPVKVITSSNGGANWSASIYLGHEALTSFAALDGPNTPIALKTLNARLRTFAIIVPATDLTLLDEVPIDGQATLQLKYW